MKMYHMNIFTFSLYFDLIWLLNCDFNVNITHRTLLRLLSKSKRHPTFCIDILLLHLMFINRCAPNGTLFGSPVYYYYTGHKHYGSKVTIYK